MNKFDRDLSKLFDTDAILQLTIEMRDFVASTVSEGQMFDSWLSNHRFFYPMLR